MTSTKTPDYPDYQFFPSVITSNGKPLATQYLYNGTVVTDVSLPKESQQKKNNLEKLLNEYESSINIFSPEFNEQIESIANAKKIAALNDFHSLYEPAYNKAREDYFERLGTLDSTAYLDRANRMEATKQNAYAGIINDYYANLDELKNNELSRRYDYLNYLQNSLNNINNENANYLNSINSISSKYTNDYNTYQSNAYRNQYSNSSGVNWGQMADLAALGLSYL